MKKENAKLLRQAKRFARHIKNALQHNSTVVTVVGLQKSSKS
nr:MAG TPA: hypothetical protein [Caudoviricetes sp.]